MNLCGYYSKGVADHVGIWDFDEFFVPRGKNRNILDVIDNAYSVIGVSPDAQNGTVGRPGGPGWADGKDHPYCYMQIK